MNYHELCILKYAMLLGAGNQRRLSEASGYSLGKVNQTLSYLVEDGYLEIETAPAFTEKANRFAAQMAPKRAVILAAGYGLRMSPMNREIPKAFIEVDKKPLIERLIEQLQEAGICEIYVVVGFMKEAFDYLVDRYGVKLLVNTEYREKNNLYSLARAVGYLENCYIVPCDIWCEENPFHKIETYSWYMVDEEMEAESPIHVNRKGEIVLDREVRGGVKLGLPREEGQEPSMGNRMIGIAYVAGEEAKSLRERIYKMTGVDEKGRLPREKAGIPGPYDQSYWEEACILGDRVLLPAMIHRKGRIYEVNTYEELRGLDEDSEQLRSDIILLLAKELQCNPEDITEVTLQKKGMTNRSFVFTCWDKRYIMRIPGEGTELLINRREEYEVYRRIRDYGICDPVHYINPENGYKLSEYLEGARVCDANNVSDLRKCMKKLKDFHKLNLVVKHSFDLFEKIAYYEELRGEVPSSFRDYEKTKANVFELRDFIDLQKKDYCLTHIDAIPDNFLFVKEEKASQSGGKGKAVEEQVYLIDWEYSGMQDPHVDLAMFAVYSLYDREETDRLIDLYFEDEGGCKKEVRYKIYAYLAICGLLWSNWCDYKKTLGVEFGEYSMAQYRYAKDYYRIVKEEFLNQ